jgi:glyoxylase-like metal-dependent hydrolase (beta-lactamase superfamily II)
MDCTVIAHEKTAQAFHNRPNTFKAQGDETGANWEAIPGLGSVRWAPPEISFGQQLTLHWGESPVILESRPGPTSGAIWVVLPQEKVVFVGDAVLKGQPPFLAHADLPAWLEALELLQGPDYKGFTVVSGRDGVVTPQAVRSYTEELQHIHEKVDALGKKRASVAATEKLAEQFLKDFKAPVAKQKQYAHRLSHGLQNYYIRHYQPSAKHVVEE